MCPPKLFHHGPGESEISRADTGGEENGEERRGKGDMRGMWNLGCGSRHGQLWVEGTDREMRRLVKESVRSAVQTGGCPIDAVMEEGSWKGCEFGQCGAQS